jgi:CRP/FNR family transcriptional regulator, cyclic AMP receptor protein
VGLFSQNTKVEALKRAPLFEGLSKKELNELARLADDLEVEEGTVLCREGALGQEFFAVVEGEVEVTKGGKRVRSRERLDFFGEIALVSNVKRTATVTAKTPLRCFVMTRSQFRQVLDHNPAMQRKVLEAMGDRLASSGDEL